MGNVLTALIMAAGVSGFVYAKMGRRIGYGNSQNIWTLVGVSFVLTFLITIIIFTTFIN